MSKFSSRKPQAAVGRKLPQTAVSQPLCSLAHAVDSNMSSWDGSEQVAIFDKLDSLSVKSFKDLYQFPKGTTKRTLALLDSKESMCKTMDGVLGVQKVVVTSRFLLDVCNTLVLEMKRGRITDGHKKDVICCSVVKVLDLLHALRDSKQKALQVTVSEGLCKYFMSGSHSYSSYRYRGHAQRLAEFIPWLSKRYEPKAFRKMSRTMYKKYYNEMEWKAWSVNDDYFKTNIPVDVAFAEVVCAGQLLN